MTAEHGRASRRRWWPFTGYRGAHASAIDPLSAQGTGEGPELAGEKDGERSPASSTPPPHPYPVDPPPQSRIAAARRWLAEFDERYPLLEPGTALDPVVDALLTLALGGREAAATLDTAYRHCQKHSTGGFLA